MNFKQQYQTLLEDFKKRDFPKAIELMKRYLEKHLKRKLFPVKSLQQWKNSSEEGWGLKFLVGDSFPYPAIRLNFSSNEISNKVESIDIWKRNGLGNFPTVRILSNEISIINLLKEILEQLKSPKIETQTVPMLVESLDLSDLIKNLNDASVSVDELELNFDLMNKVFDKIGSGRELENIQTTKVEVVKGESEVYPPIEKKKNELKKVLSQESTPPPSFSMEDHINFLKLNLNRILKTGLPKVLILSGRSGIGKTKEVQELLLNKLELIPKDFYQIWRDEQPEPYIDLFDGIYKYSGKTIPVSLAKKHFKDMVDKRWQDQLKFINGEPYVEIPEYEKWEVDFQNRWELFEEEKLNKLRKIQGGATSFFDLYEILFKNRNILLFFDDWKDFFGLNDPDWIRAFQSIAEPVNSDRILRDPDAEYSSRGFVDAVMGFISYNEKEMPKEFNFLGNIIISTDDDFNNLENNSELKLALNQKSVVKINLNPTNRDVLSYLEKKLSMVDIGTIEDRQKVLDVFFKSEKNTDDQSNLTISSYIDALSTYIEAEENGMDGLKYLRFYSI